MKKKVFFIAFILIVLFIMPYSVSAKEDDRAIEDLNNNPKILRFYDYINNLQTKEEILNDLNIKEYVKTYLKTGKGNLSFGKVIKAISNGLFKEVHSTLKLMISLITLAIIGALIKNLQDAFNNDNISNIAFYACFAVMAIILTKSFLISLDLAKDTIKSLSDFMLALLPTLVVLLASAGGIVGAAIIDPVVFGAVTLTPRLYVDVLIPLILMGFVLVFVNNISEDHKISGLCKLFKQIVLWIQGIVITIFIGILTIRGISSNTMDAVALKTAKFAVDNFIPIVGKVFSDAITTIAGYSLLLKNAISGIGLIVVVAILLFPVIKMILMIFTYKITASLIEPIGDKRIVECISFAGDSLVLIMSTMLTLSIMFFVTITMMASSGKFVVGG